MRLYVPTLRASLVAKGAAYLADSRERNRHLSDFITLLACVEDAAEMREGLSARSRKRVRVALRALGEPSSREVWARAESVTRTLAEEIMHDMNLAFDTTGTTGR